MEKRILFNDPSTAIFKTNISGWVSCNGIFYGNEPDSERLARYDGCTHKACITCGKPTLKIYAYCDDCQKTMNENRYKWAKSVNWDEKNTSIF